MLRNLLLLTLIFSIISCSPKIPKTAYEETKIPTAPDYAKKENWAALPTEKDQADRTPDPTLLDLQATAEADVFWLHPTTYTKKRGNTLWNAPTNDPKLNKTTDNGSILNQASIFNGAGKVYAPRYRQAHIQAYYTENKTAAKKAFALAYSDVKSAFEFYLKEYNPVNPSTGERRPIVIASHSQGTNHATQLLKDYFDGKELQKYLVAAYLVGMPIQKDTFQNIKVCETPEETNCFCSWRTWKYGHTPKVYSPNNNIAVTNPLTWTTDPKLASEELNKGTVLQKFEKNFTENLVDAKVQDGVLWAHKPKFRGSIFVTFKNYHIVDLNFYYVNVRENAMARVKAFLDQ